MPETRYPSVCFHKLHELSKKSSNIGKYNWISIAKEIFFEPIIETEIWENLNNFLMPETTERLISLYNNHLHEVDLESYAQSSSLYIYPDLTIDKISQYYLSFNINHDIKRIFAQLKLLNKYNTRIITKNKIFKLNKNIDCNYCNITDDNLYHALFECEKYKGERLKYFNNLKNE